MNIFTTGTNLRGKRAVDDEPYVHKSMHFGGEAGPGREPWVMIDHRCKPRQGRHAFACDRCRPFGAQFFCERGGPTAYAVGYEELRLAGLGTKTTARKPHGSRRGPRKVTPLQGFVVWGAMRLLNARYTANAVLVGSAVRTKSPRAGAIVCEFARVPVQQPKTGIDQRVTQR